MSDGDMTRLTVRTTVTLPDIDADALKKRGRVYILVDDVAAWLDDTADAFDKAHAERDIGIAIRACAAEVRSTRVQ